MPRRQVAVKVMLSEVVNDQVRQMFQAEANLMAQLSALERPLRNYRNQAERSPHDQIPATERGRGRKKSV